MGFHIDVAANNSLLAVLGSAGMFLMIAAVVSAASLASASSHPVIRVAAKACRECSRAPAK